MQYTITSRGRPIGTTDLGFRYRPGASRIGWFQPNADGERLMPVVSAVTATTRVYAQSIRRRRRSPGVGARDGDATLLADVAEARQHAGALDLELHAEDGTLIPTEIVSIQDTEELLAWGDIEEAIEWGEAWKRGDRTFGSLCGLTDDSFDEALDADERERQFDPADDDAVIFGDGFADTLDAWTPDEYEPDPMMRYQIFVELVDAGAIP